MFRSTHHAATARMRAVATVIATVALAAAPATQAADYRSPDARAQAAVTPVNSPTDLRSPDARDSQHVGSEFASPPVDLRSPDARDATHVGTQFASPESPNTFDFGEGALIAGGTLALLLIALGGWLVARRHSSTIRDAHGPVVSR
jgi:hypothetical protein